jgi:DNA-binding NarL/FixJ family response regulator
MVGAMSTCCLAGIAASEVSTFFEILRDAGEPGPITVARLNVSELGRLSPHLLVCDVDSVLVDPLELLRQIRFVLPECIIAVYTGMVTRARSRACHLAGANCLLSKTSKLPRLTRGLRSAVRSGCFTDPSFAS